MYYLFVYRCTCPPKLYLSDDDRTCREALDGKLTFLLFAFCQLLVYIFSIFVNIYFFQGASTSTSTESSIVVNLLPTDCLWSEWSDW